MAKKLHERLIFDGTKNKGKVHAKIEKTCIICSSKYTGSKQSRYCSRKCSNQGNIAWAKANPDKVKKYRKKCYETHKTATRSYVVDQEEFYPKRKSNKCECCGKVIEEFTGYQNYCLYHRQHRPKEEKYIPIVDYGLLKDYAIGESTPVMTTIEQEYPNQSEEFYHSVFNKLSDILEKVDGWFE